MRWRGISHHWTRLHRLRPSPSSQIIATYRHAAGRRTKIEGTMAESTAAAAAAAQPQQGGPSLPQHTPSLVSCFVVYMNYCEVTMRASLGRVAPLDVVTHGVRCSRRGTRRAPYLRSETEVDTYIQLYILLSILFFCAGGICTGMSRWFWRLTLNSITKHVSYW